jgi:hypothetical protein
MFSVTSPLTQQRSNIIQQLERELSKLKNRFQIALELQLEWLPGGDSKKSGEVIGRTIYIYERDESKALDTLRHEFIDYIISVELEAPYKRLINKLISVFEEDMYERKERLIEKLLEVV